MLVKGNIYRQRGESILPQELLSYQYEEEKNKAGATALAGLPVYLDLAQVMGFSASGGRHVKVREGSRGYTDSQMMSALVLLNLAGGELGRRPEDLGG